MAPLAGDDPFAHGHRGIGDGREVCRAGQEHPLVVVEGHARGHRDDDFSLQLLLQGFDDARDLMGFHGDDDHVGEVRDLGRRVEGPHAERFRIALQFGTVARRGAELRGLQGPRAEESAGQGPGHVSESDKSDFHLFSMVCDV